MGRIFSEDSYVCVDPPDEPTPDLDYSLADEIRYVSLLHQNG